MLMLVNSKFQKHQFAVSKYDQMFLQHALDQKRVLFFLLNDGCQISRRVSDDLDQSVTWHAMCPSTIDRGERKRESHIVLQDFGYNKIAGKVQCSNQIVEKFNIFEEIAQSFEP